MVDWIRTSANDWAPAIQAVAAIAALVVALVATAIAARAQRAEEVQAKAAREALQLAQDQNLAASQNEIARRAEVQILGADMLTAEPKLDRSERVFEGVIVRNPHESRVAFAVALTCRGLLEGKSIRDLGAVSTGSIPPRGSQEFMSSLAWFTVNEDKNEWDPTWLVDEVEFGVESRGLLGQTIRQVFTLDVSEMKLPDDSELNLPEWWWWESRRVITPNVAGAEPVVFEFTRQVPDYGEDR
jgi:hypothetical protein